jgi:hypothetical protein
VRVPREVVALVSADDFVSAVRVYSDRVNDLLRRNGVPALEAIEVCETHALALLDAVVNAPETVIDLAGWWFARAIEFTNQDDRVDGVNAAEEPISVLAGTPAEEQVRDSLLAIPDVERAAVMLRDGYDLPGLAVGVALRRGVDSAAALVAAGRLHLVAAYDGRRAPDLSGHSGRTTVDLVTLSALADGTLEAPRAAPLRRHVSNCASCEEVMEALARGRRLAAGLPIIAMDDDAREAMIDRIAGRAEVVLPSHEAVLRAVDEDHDPGPPVSPVLSVIVLVLALVLGVGVAVISHGTGEPAAVPKPTNTFVPTDEPTLFPVNPTTPRRHLRRTPTTVPTTPKSRPTRSNEPSTIPTPTPTESTPPPVRGPPRIKLSPTHGRAGTTITVSGAGFPPDTIAHLSYAGGRSTATTPVDATGHFVGQLQAEALLPGPQTVTARDRGESANAVFTQQL